VAEEKLRLFFAVPLAEALRDACCELQEQMGEACRRGPRIKWVERPNLHMTLKFLGDTPASEVERICRIAERVAGQCSPASLQLGGVGCFPPRGAPSTIWVGLREDCPEIMELAERLDAALAEAGVSEPERRSFVPHFTLGRVRDRGGVRRLRELIERLSEAPVGPMDVTRFCLMSSDLTPHGPIYTEREVFELLD